MAGIIMMLGQTIWIREFTTVFGVHAISVTALLAAFALCFAMGSYLFGKIADRKINKLVLFTIMQGVIGIFIVLHPFFFGKIKNLFLSLNNLFDLGPFSVMFIRIIISFFYFLIPVSLMGGVLPVLGKLTVRNMTDLGRQFGILYGCYVSGMLAGSLLTGFVFIKFFGINNTLLIAAAISLIMALGSWLVFHSQKGKKLQRTGQGKSFYTDEFVTVAAGKWKKRLLWFFTITSFSTLTYKIIWTRTLLESSADKTIYFYSVLSVSFIACLALGSFIVSRFADKIKKKFFVLALIEIFIGLTSIIVVGIFNEISNQLTLLQTTGIAWIVSMLGKAGMMLGLFLVPLSLTGFVFPLVVRMYAEDLKTLGAKIGILGLLDVIGAVVASFTIPFILIPLVGTYNVFLGAALLNIGIGIFILLRYRRIKNIIRISLTLASVILFVGITVLFGQKKMVPGSLTFTGADMTEMRHEGSTATVEVHKNAKGNIILYINGDKAVSSDPAELKADKLMSYLPYLFKPDAKRVFIIGLGIGITAKSMAELNVQDIEIVEISPEVTNVAANAYAYVNDNVLVHEKISIAIEDGRSFLLRSKKLYDIIICNAAHPRLGNALYTEDYYRLCSEKLSRDGCLCQWLPIGWLSQDEFRSLIRSCTNVFSHVTLWYAASGQMLLLASPIPLQLDLCKSRSLLDFINRQGALTSSGINDIDMILTGLIADDASLRNYTINIPANTDIYPRVEFSHVVESNVDEALLKQLSSMRINFKNIILFDSCPEDEHEILDLLPRKNAELKKEMMEEGRVISKQ